MTPYAEVIGDPIAHSRSPAIHAFWLAALGIDGAYHATQVTGDGLAGFLATRSADRDWRGCNVTAPHKQAVIPLLDEVAETVRRVGAVNCIRRDGGRLVGLNTDVDGVTEALAGANLAGGRLAVIGAGGGARAAIAHAVAAKAGAVTVIVRSPERAVALIELATLATSIRIVPIERAADGVAGAAAIVNATPMGMGHALPMPASLLENLGAAPGAVALDMVYSPLDTPFLAAARAAGLRAVDGLAMLVGQARRAFEIFFAAMPPASKDAELRKILASDADQEIRV